MKWLRGLLVGVAVGLWLTAPASGLETTPSPVEYRSPIFVTAFQVTVNPLGSSAIDAIELYNESDTPINLSGWRIEGLNDGIVVCQLELANNDVYILPNHYVVTADNTVLQSEYILSYDQPCNQASTIDSLRLHAPERAAETINDIEAGAWVRKGVTATYRDEDDNFDDNFALLVTRTPAVLYADKLYQPLESTPLVIVEILPRSKDCSPTDTVTVGCYDYVKVFNPMDEIWSLDNLRLRIGHQGQNVTSSNAIQLGGSIDARSYGVIRTQADGDPLGISDSGGWVWLEDRYGLQRYDATIIHYKSATIDYEAIAWALDEATGSWQWTTTPTPYNQPNNITEPSAEGVVDSNNQLTPCRSDQFRNPLTNRCKLKESTATDLVPCATNQFRNPVTNRCKLKVATASSLTPCGPGQFRNPATNRCKSTASNTANLKPCAANQFRNPATNRCKLTNSNDSLKPCEKGWQRNALTNRCRKTTSSVLAGTDYPVKPYGDSAQQAGSWAAFAVVGGGAVGYGLWEWRREISGIFAKLRVLVGK